MSRATPLPRRSDGDDFGDLRGRVVRWRPGIYDMDPHDHPFHVVGGFGAKGKGKLFGTWLGDDDPEGDAGWGRRDWVDRVLSPDELTSTQRRRLELAQQRAVQRGLSLPEASAAIDAGPHDH